MSTFVFVVVVWAVWAVPVVVWCVEGGEKGGEFGDGRRGGERG